MCCPLDQIHGKVDIQEITIDQANNSAKIRGTFERRPATVSDYCLRLFQRLELTEKIAEIADESFHLFASVLREFAPAKVFQTLRNLHNGAHDIEHTLHAVCFLGDVTRIFTGSFFHDHHKRFIGYAQSASRIFHAVAHCFAFVQSLVDHKLIKLKRFQPILAYAQLFSAIGFAIWSAMLIWRRYQGEENKRFKSDLAIHVGGFFFEAIPMAKIASGKEFGVPYVDKLVAMAGIVHAWFVVDRLMPPDSEKFKTECKLNSSQPAAAHIHDETKPACADHHHDHDDHPHTN